MRIHIERALLKFIKDSIVIYQHCVDFNDRFDNRNTIWKGNKRSSHHNEWQNGLFWLHICKNVFKGKKEKFNALDNTMQSLTTFITESYYINYLLVSGAIELRYIDAMSEVRLFAVS